MSWSPPCWSHTSFNATQKKGPVPPLPNPFTLTTDCPARSLGRYLGRFGECHQGKLSHPVTPVMWETWKMRIQQDPKHGHVARCRLSKFGDLESLEFGEAGCLAMQFISQLILVTYPYQPRFRPLWFLDFEDKKKSLPTGNLSGDHRSQTHSHGMEQGAIGWDLERHSSGGLRAADEYSLDIFVDLLPWTKMCIIYNFYGKCHH